jgi:hypothetical protein
MFGTLRKNSVFYILNKDTFTLEEGLVIDVTNPTPKFSNLGTFNTDTIVDIVVKAGEQDYRFEKVPSNVCIANAPNNIIISEDRNAIMSEIEDSIRQSNAVLQSIPYHESVIKNGEDIKRRLNPQFAKEKKQEEDISNLKSEVGDIKNTLTTMMGILNNLNKENPQ